MTTTMESPRIVSREEWLVARRALLTKEKGLTRLRDRLAAERRALPWVRVEKPYVFDGPQGPITLADLFDGPQPALRQALHDGAGPSGPVCRVLPRS
jgi:predicted dithiol-disulfide oxidoreductase (DUF899 family)